MRDLLLASQQKPLSFWRSTSTSGWRNEPGQEPSTPGHHRKLSACRRTWEMTVVMTEKKCCVVIHPSVAMLLLSAEPCSPNWAKRFCRAESQQKPQRCSGGGEKPGCVGYLQRAGVSFPASVSSSKLQCSLHFWRSWNRFRKWLLIDLSSLCWTWLFIKESRYSILLTSNGNWLFTNCTEPGINTL